MEYILAVLSIVIVLVVVYAASKTKQNIILETKQKIRNIVANSVRSRAEEIANKSRPTKVEVRKDATKSFNEALRTLDEAGWGDIRDMFDTKPPDSVRATNKDPDSNS